jgi:hypothetical protein
LTACRVFPIRAAAHGIGLADLVKSGTDRGWKTDQEMKIMSTLAPRCLLAAAACLTMPVLSAVAQDVAVPAPSQPAATERPVRGMHMDTVIARWGEPAERLAPVGGGSAAQPPITRWVYPAFTVYFENSLVISSVTKRPATTAAGEPPAQ